MGVAKGTIQGNPYIGAFASASDECVLVGRNIALGEEKVLKETLGVKIVKIAIDGSDLVGIYAVANSNRVLVPGMIRQEELEHMKRELPGVKIGVLETDLNALRNNILVNDKIAFVNPEYKDYEIKQIEEMLGVEAKRLSVGGFETVGANNILTNKGIVLNNRATENEAEEVKRLVASTSQTTANLGSPNIGLCVVANSKGLVVGNDTTGYELTRMTDALDL